MIQTFDFSHYVIDTTLTDPDGRAFVHHAMFYAVEGEEEDYFDDAAFMKDTSAYVVTSPRDFPALLMCRQTAGLIVGGTRPYVQLYRQTVGILEQGTKDRVRANTFSVYVIQQVSE